MKPYAWVGSFALALAAPAIAQHPIVFVTQVPIPQDFGNVVSTFANHQAQPDRAPRGGDLWIRYPDGSTRNLTQAAGFGMNGLQGANAIAVRNPSPSFDASRIVFSMVVGAPNQFQVGNYRWQLYEASGLGPGDTVSIAPVPNQPTQFNNILPIYLPDGDIVFASDRPRNGALHLYPQHDEYESAPTNTGLWRLRPSTGALTLLQHSPSGSFDPLVDSAGRIVFSRWDHLQRDQQADLAGNPNGNFNWASEASNAPRLAVLTEHFPEPRISINSVWPGHEFNQFFPWAIRQDGSEEETLNHLGRHDLVGFVGAGRNDDPGIVGFDYVSSGRPIQRFLYNAFQLSEDPLEAGRFLAVDAPEFAAHASGQVLALRAPQGQNPLLATLDYLTPKSTALNVLEGATPPADHSGHWRNPIRLSDGRYLVAHTSETRGDSNIGTATAPLSRYDFQLKTASWAGQGSLQLAGPLLGARISESLSWWSPDVLISYSGPLWELSPVELRPRTPPVEAPHALGAAEAAVFAAAGVDPGAFSADLRARGLGLLVVRDATTRDRADRQQPYNLRVPGGRQTIGNGGTLYDIAYMQFFQGDQVRGIGGIGNPRAGRRVLAQPLHEADALGGTPAVSTQFEGAVGIAADGSVAALVPARRALSWQAISPAGTPVVRERYWVSVQAGEIRVCDGCHGVNQHNQANQAASVQSPQALLPLLNLWLQQQEPFFRDGFE